MSYDGLPCRIPKNFVQSETVVNNNNILLLALMCPAVCAVDVCSYLSGDLAVVMLFSVERHSSLCECRW